MFCKCGHTRCLECTRECSQCGDKIENYLDAIENVGCSITKSVQANNNMFASDRRPPSQIMVPNTCSKCLRHVSEMTGPERDKYFNNGRCCNGN